jgi:mevalonate kinase
VTNQRYYSNGKLLISGEYLVLKGATALAVPLKFGQNLEVFPETNDDYHLRWKAMMNNVFWFEAVLDIDSMAVIESSDLEKAKTLSELLKQADGLNPKVLKNTNGFDVVTHADFDINWGLGSSSTLIANVAQWFSIDAYQLHFKVSSGSAYDIACANADGPIFYTLDGENPFIEAANFNPDFSDKLYFVYLGRKQKSDKSIVDFASRLEGRNVEIERISEISRELTATNDLEEFEFFINESEQIMSEVLDLPTVKETTFKDFPGAVKSLGAWGGDFVMMTWEDGIEELKQYLQTKNLDVVFAYDEIVLKKILD